MALCKKGQIHNCCLPNALITLKEYLEDYASPLTREICSRLIQDELANIPKEAVRKKVAEWLDAIEREDELDFRF